MLSDILHNPVYQRKRIDGHTCEPLVSAGLFKRVQDRLSSSPIGRRGPTKRPPALLASVLRCAKCDGPMYRLTTRDGDAYRCHGKTRERRSTCRNMIRLDLLDGIADEAMSADQRHIYERRVVHQGTTWDPEIENTEAKIRSLDLDRADYDERLAELRAERTRLKALAPELDVIENVDTGVSYAQRWADADHEGKRKLLLGHVVVSFQWDEIDGERFPVAVIGPEWAESGTSVVRRSA